MVKISSAYCIEPKVGKILGFFVFVIYGLIAQLAEQRTFNPKVVGSMPTQPTKYRCMDIIWNLSSMVRALAF